MKQKMVFKLTSGVLLGTMLLYTSPVLAFTKEETVYSKLDGSGRCYQTIVNSHLKNDEQAELLEDLSDLLEIQNVNGNEELSQNENRLIWKANGNDIYYQGNSQKDLPIVCDVSYTLDGNEISAQDLAGKSGRVTIKLSYVNQDAHVVKVNGKEETLYTPFVVVAGTIMDNTTHKNIEITNGKVIDDGTKTTVIGLCLPGLQDSLKVSSDTLLIPNDIEISMDATDFELNSIASFVTPKVIEDTDLRLFDELDQIYDKIHTLESSSKQLVDGANSLRDGATTYHEKSSEFYTVMKQFSSGVSDANASYSKINSGIDTLNQGSASLEDGAKTIRDGTKAVSTNLKVVDTKLGDLQAGMKRLQAGEKQLADGVNQIVSEVSKVSVPDYSAKIAELEKLVKANTSTKEALKASNASLNAQLKSATDENTKATLKAQIEANNSLISLLDTNTKATNSTIATLKSTDTSMMKELQNGLSDLKKGLTDLQTGTQDLYDGSSALKGATNTLSSKTNELYEGSKSLYEGTLKVSEGTKTLRSGSKQMKNGLSTLDASSKQLTQANSQLVDGANSLSSGANSLAAGMNQFDKEGIQMICRYLNGDLKDVSTRFELLQDLAEQYSHFTMLQDGCKGNVKFIMMMDSIKKSDEHKEVIVLNEDENKKEE